MGVVSTTHLFHYAVVPDADFGAILAEGLRPLSDFPESERWQELERHAPGVFEELYRLFAEPVLRRPYERSGIFLTPVDFRVLPGTLLRDRTRLFLHVPQVAAYQPRIPVAPGDVEPV